MALNCPEGFHCFLSIFLGDILPGRYRELHLPGPGANRLRHALLLLLLPFSAGAQQYPLLPRVFLNTSYPPLTGKSVTVPAGGDLQAAINSANLGDEIVLQAGATYTGNFTLPAKTGSGWIVIRSSSLSVMPEHTRVGPQNAASMAQVVTNSSYPVFSNITNGAVSDRAAQFYRFAGLEITVTPDLPLVWNLILIEDEESTDPTGMPHDIVVDRCWVHGNSNAGMERGIWLGGSRMSVIDSYFSSFQDIGYETQAIYGQDGPGPFKIVNNYLESAGENIMFGAPIVSGIIPADITIHHNYISKPLSWQGTSYDIKNLFEIKNAQRVLFDGNVLENCWPAAQSGFGVVWIPRSTNGEFPLALAQDITFTDNVVRNTTGGINVAGLDDQCPAGDGCVTSHRVLIRNNLFYNVTETLGGPGYLLQTANMHEFTVDHNTMQAICNTATCWAQFVVTYPTTNEIISNNIINQNVGGQSLIGPVSLFDTVTSIVDNNSGNSLTTNLLYGPGYDNNLTQTIVQAEWFPFAASTYFATSANAVGFVDYAGNNFALAPNSPYKGLGTDGQDLGYNPAAIDINGIVNGTYSN